MTLKTPLAALALMAGLFGGAQAAQAMPVGQAGAVIDQAVDHGDTGLLVQAAYGCGRGWHPNRWGRCVPYGRPVFRPYYRTYGFYGPRWHRPAYGFYGPRWHHHGYWR